MRSTLLITLMGLLAAIAVAGCTPQPTGPTVMVMPSPTKSFAQFQNDQVVCTNSAQQQSGASQQQYNIAYSQCMYSRGNQVAGLPPQPNPTPSQTTTAAAPTHQQVKPTQVNPAQSETQVTFVCIRRIFPEEERLMSTIDGSEQRTNEVVQAITYLRAKFCRNVQSQFLKVDYQVARGERCGEYSGLYLGERVYWGYRDEKAGCQLTATPRVQTMGWAAFNQHLQDCSTYFRRFNAYWDPLVESVACSNLIVTGNFVWLGENNPYPHVRPHRDMSERNLACCLQMSSRLGTKVRVTGTYTSRAATHAAELDRENCQRSMQEGADYCAWLR